MQQARDVASKIESFQQATCAAEVRLEAYAGGITELASHEQHITQQLLQLSGQLADLKAALADLSSRLEEMRHARGRLGQQAGEQQEVATPVVASAAVAVAVPATPASSGPNTAVNSELQASRHTIA